MKRTVIVLDAMGVMYRAGDDVAELLVPYVAAHGGASAERVEAAYLRASRGELGAAELWRSIGLDETHEDPYLLRHEINPGLLPFLRWAQAHEYELACLSNDVSEWSKKLRRRFGLDQFISTWVISGDAKARKPEPAIYRALIEALGRDPQHLLFVDDRQKNLEAARVAGLRPAAMGREPLAGGYPLVRDFEELRQLVQTIEAS